MNDGFTSTDFDNLPRSFPTMPQRRNKRKPNKAQKDWAWGKYTAPVTSSREVDPDWDDFSITDLVKR